MARQRPGDDSTETRLVAAAQRVLLRDGLAAVTVRKVAAEAQLSVGVLYNHFDGADDLIASALTEQMRSVGAGIPAESAADLAAYARALLDQIRKTLPFAAGLIERPALQAKLMEHSGGFEHPQLGSEVSDALKAAQTRGEIDARANVEDIVLGVTTLVHGVGLMEMLSGQPTTAPWLDRMLKPYEKALRPD